MATLGGHVTVEDYVNISAGSGVHQFCRVGRHAFIGGYSVVTKDALPFARTVGSRPARIYGANTIGLVRRGFTPDVVAKLKRSFRYLLQSKLNTTRALQQIEQDQSLACAEVQYLIDFIRSSQRGVILRRAVAAAPKKSSRMRTSNGSRLLMRLGLIAGQRPLSVPRARRRPRRSATTSPSSRSRAKRFPSSPISPRARPRPRSTGSRSGSSAR